MPLVVYQHSDCGERHKAVYQSRNFGDRTGHGGSCGVYSVPGSLLSNRLVCCTKTIRLPRGRYVVVIGETKYKAVL